MTNATETNEGLRRRVLEALAKLGVLVAAPGAIALCATQVNLGENGADLGRQYEATVVQCTAALFYAATGVVHPAFAVPRYLMAVLSIVEILESLNGFGDPDTGGEFRQGIDMFSRDIPCALRSAAPAGWYSNAAARYADTITRSQENPAEKTAAADQIVAKTLAEQAFWIRQSRQTLAILRTAVAAAIPTAIVWAKIIDAYEGLPGQAAEEEVAAQLRKLDYYGLLCARFATAGAVVVVGGLIAVGERSADDFNMAKQGYQAACGVGGVPGG